jgi:hypothetical protein
MLNKKITSFFRLLLLVILIFSFENCHQPSAPEISHENQAQKINLPEKQETVDNAVLNRHPQHIHFSKHAKCRMGCRHIDETEIKEILEKGSINYKKSILNGDPCRRKFAVEGPTREGQRLRVIFAPCGNEMTVVTCIDLGVEWTCDCK